MNVKSLNFTVLTMKFYMCHHTKLLIYLNLEYHTICTGRIHICKNFLYFLRIVVLLHYWKSSGVNSKLFSSNHLRHFLNRGDVLFGLFISFPMTCIKNEDMIPLVKTKVLNSSKSNGGLTSNSAQDEWILLT